MAKVILKSNFIDFIKSLSEERRVFVPIKNGESLRIERVLSETDLNNLDFSNSNSVLPPKSLFFPPQEVIFEVGEKVSVPENSEPFVLFCSYKDLEGILELDEIMNKEPGDFYYARARQSAIIVAIKDEAMSQRQGGDLILEDMGDYYIVTVFSEKGKNLLKNDFFEEKDIKIKKLEKKSSELENLLLDSELLKDAIVWSYNHPIWDELAETCMGCGICTYVCPLCYCFSSEDEKSFDGKKCQRCRRWDSCILPDFALIAGGKNFRPTLKQRYYNWYYHKFVRAYQEFGRPHCVACGRCQTYCPAQIDIYQVLSRIVGDYKKTLK